MATMKGKPRGYFQYALAVDCETTGLCFKNYDNDENPVFNPSTGERHQALSWGMLIVDVSDFSVVDELYIEVQWNEHSLQQRLKDPQFGRKAEEVHGLTRTHLEDKGVPEEEAVMLIGDMILKYFGPDNAIKLIGHNVHLFDLAFLRDLFKRHEIPLKFGNRHYDTNSGAFMTFGTFNSDDLFSEIGYPERAEHNALEDIKLTVEACRIMRIIFQKALNG